MSASSCRASSAYVLASYRRTDERSAEAGLKYFVLGALASRHPALRHFAALRLHRDDPVRGHRRGVRPRRHPVDRPAVRPGVPARRPGLQDQRGAVPHVDARRLRRRADAGDRLLRLRAQGRRGAARRPRLPRRAGAGDRRLAADHDLRRAGLDHPRRGRGLWPDQHQAAAGLFVDQQCRLRADRPGRRRRRRARRRCCSTWRSMS